MDFDEDIHETQGKIMRWICEQEQGTYDSKTDRIQTTDSPIKCLYKFFWKILHSKK